MLRNRVIPCLLLSDEKLVKTRLFKDPKYIGDPINAIRIFNDKEVDELIVLDIKASKNKKEPNYDLIEQFASECFMPLSYGGGIRTIEQAKILFSIGVEKICIQSAALEEKTFIKDLSSRFGSSSIIFSLDLKKNWLGNTKAFSYLSQSWITQPWLDLLKTIVNEGAGEIFLNSINFEGTMTGMNLDVIKQTISSLNVPIIFSGGVGSIDDIKMAFSLGANSVSAGSFFVFHGPHRAVLITYPNRKELDEFQDVL